MASEPIYLTIQRRGDTIAMDLTEDSPVVPHGEVVAYSVQRLVIIPSRRHERAVTTVLVEGSGECAAGWEEG